VLAPQPISQNLIRQRSHYNNAASVSTLGAAIVFTASVAGSSATMPTGRIVIMVNGQVVADEAVTPVSGQRRA
jgi:hypothetical protein